MENMNVLVLGEVDKTLSDWLESLSMSPVCMAVVFVPDVKSARRIMESLYIVNVVILTGYGPNKSLQMQVESIQQNTKGREAPQILALINSDNSVGPCTLRDLRISAAHSSKDIVSFLEKYISDFERTEKKIVDVGGPIQRMTSSKQNRFSKNILTPRQAEVMGLVNLGNSNKEIARALDLTEGTIKVHCKAIFRALGVANRTQAAVLMSKADFDLEAS